MANVPDPKPQTEQKHPADWQRDLNPKCPFSIRACAFGRTWKWSPGSSWSRKTACTTTCGTSSSRSRSVSIAAREAALRDLCAPDNR
jgi:hypothetical protein